MELKFQIYVKRMHTNYPLKIHSTFSRTCAQWHKPHLCTWNNDHWVTICPLSQQAFDVFKGKNPIWRNPFKWVYLLCPCKTLYCPRVFLFESTPPTQDWSGSWRTLLLSSHAHLSSFELEKPTFGVLSAGGRRGRS
jgi:hypothetical protein